MRRHIFLRNYEAWGHLEMLLVSAVAAVLTIRLFLELTDYPQVGGAGLHIAHMLWGGLFMLTSIFMLLSYLGKTFDRWAAVAGGLGFGIFIDEIGKFVTADNDYFFRPAISLMYVCFVFLFLAMHAVHARPRYSQREYLMNALQKLEDLVMHDLDPDERRQVLALLKRSDPDDPLVRNLRQVLTQAQLVPPRRPGLSHRVRRLLRRLYRRIACLPQFPKIVILVFVVQLLLKLAYVSAIVFLAGFGRTAVSVQAVFGWVMGRIENLTFADYAQLVSSLLSGFFVLLGVIAIRHSRAKAFQLFEQSLLVSIFLTQVFSFYREQFFALIGLIFNIALLVVTRYVQRQERYGPRGYRSSNLRDAELMQ